MQTNLLRLPHDQMQTNTHLKSKSTRENGHPIEKQTAKYPTNSHSLKTLKTSNTVNDLDYNKGKGLTAIQS